MDGIHDMGGMQGFGRVEPERDEPVFHAEWEPRVFALLSAAAFSVGFCDDQFRPAVEAMEPADYLRASYYRRWQTAMEQLLSQRGALAAGQLAGAMQPVRAGEVMPALLTGASQARPLTADVPARFKPGDRVLTNRHFGTGHNRLPRYARDRVGRIESAQGVFLVADANEMGRHEPEMLYTVVFTARELWGPQAPPTDSISLDFWDRYLKLAE